MSSLEEQRRLRMITGEQHQRKKEELHKALEPGARMCFEVTCCWNCSAWFEDQSKRCACSASMFAIFYGGLLIGYAAGKSNVPACLVCGITAVVLGTVTSGGCAHEFLCKSDSAPVEQQPEVGRPAVISKPRWEKKNSKKASDLRNQGLSID